MEVLCDCPGTRGLEDMHWSYLRKHSNTASYFINTMYKLHVIFFHKGPLDKYQ